MRISGPSDILGENIRPIGYSGSEYAARRIFWVRISGPSDILGQNMRTENSGDGAGYQNMRTENSGEGAGYLPGQRTGLVRGRGREQNRLKGTGPLERDKEGGEGCVEWRGGGLLLPLLECKVERTRRRAENGGNTVDRRYNGRNSRNIRRNSARGKTSAIQGQTGGGNFV